jgi:protein-L-isoaspartate(D-aspartate) O-methyltransferase
MKGALMLAILLSTSACRVGGEPQALEWKQAREKMVTQQLAAGDINDPRVLAAMRDLPRHEFVPEDLRKEAYDDRPLSIGHGQTISQPYIVAFMTEQLRLEPADRVLEVGTGSGYQGAILGRLAGEVYSIEIIEPLAQRAIEILQRLGLSNVHAKSGDGYLGWPEHAPFDAIIVTCAPAQIPPPLVAQLKEGGRMIIPVGDIRGVQELYLLKKSGGVIQRTAVLPVRFVPMTRREVRN